MIKKRIRISQLSAGNIVHLFWIPIDDFENKTTDEIQAMVIEVQDSIYNHDAFCLAYQGKSIILKGLNQSGTFIVEAI